MTEQIVSTAYVLNSTKPRLDTQVLSGNFIDGVARYKDLEPPSSGEVSDITMKKYAMGNILFRTTEILDSIAGYNHKVKCSRA
ncbi:hypothetical protein BGZ81_004528 [Podila clonocystis]|nr:hypothetical protein BGZ81_004528 [Podila clonocystis]